VLKIAYRNFDIKTKTASSVSEASYSFPLLEDRGGREGGNQSMQHSQASHKFLSYRETSTVRHSNFTAISFYFQRL